ncbi:MAG TPA: hypothetical protein PLV92_25760 [Pirellulaceae bacterium]|nr:hypothetical protein [Pirellulaceae bacterium]
MLGDCAAPDDGAEEANAGRPLDWRNARRNLVDTERVRPKPTVRMAPNAGVQRIADSIAC